MRMYVRSAKPFPFRPDAFLLQYLSSRNSQSHPSKKAYCTHVALMLFENHLYARWASSPALPSLIFDGERLHLFVAYTHVSPNTFCITNTDSISSSIPPFYFSITTTFIHPYITTYSHPPPFSSSTGRHQPHRPHLPRFLQPPHHLLPPRRPPLRPRPRRRHRRPQIHGHRLRSRPITTSHRPRETVPGTMLRDRGRASLCGEFV